MNLPQLVLHIEAPHAEDIGERISEQSFNRNTLELCASTLAQKADYPIGSEKIQYGSRNVLFIGGFK
jgi:hypothetical protein